MNNKEIANEVYNKHIAVAAVDGRLFRKTVLEEIEARTGCSRPAAATYYNNAKKAGPIIPGLGRATEQKTAIRTTKKKDDDELQADEECFSVLEIVKGDFGPAVGRCQSFLLQGDASETFDSKIKTWPDSTWLLIQGLGPLHGETFSLGKGEIEIKRHEPVTTKEDSLTE